LGLVNAIYEPEEIMPKVLDMAHATASKAPLAVQKAKQSINEGYDLNADQAIELENRLFGECFATADQKEGMAAFLGKRNPEFKGE
jgi:enoyl-CoA hydratase